MLIWMILTGGSALIGATVALFSRHSWSIYLAGAIPWSILLVALVYTVYFVPSDAPDASMWIIAQLIGGTVAAAFGVFAFKMTRLVGDFDNQVA